jgi:hypothetical protein
MPGKTWPPLPYDVAPAEKRLDSVWLLMIEFEGAGLAPPLRAYASREQAETALKQVALVPRASTCRIFEVELRWPSATP